MVYSIFVAFWILWAATAYAGHDDSFVSALAYSDNGQLVATGTNGGALSVFKRKTGKQQWQDKNTRRQILRVRFRDGDKQLVAFERSGAIWFLDARSGRILKKLDPDFGVMVGTREAKLGLGQLDESGNWMAIVGDVDSTIHILEVKRVIAGPDKLTLNYLHLVEGFHDLYGFSDESFRDMAFSSRQQRIVAVDASQVVYLSDWHTDRSSEEQMNLSVRKFGRDDDQMATGLALGAKGQFVTVGYTKKFGGVQLWDLMKGEMTFFSSYKHPGGTANRAVFNHAGDIVATSDELVTCFWQSRDNTLKRFAVVSLPRVTTISDRPSAIAFSTDDKEVAFGIEGAVALIQLNTMKVVRYLGHERPKHEPEITDEK